MTPGPARPAPWSWRPPTGLATSSARSPAPAAEPVAAPVRLGRFLWLRATSEGWWEPDVGPGEQVAEGQVLGTVSSLDGAQVLQSVTAPAPGVPMFITSSPAVAAAGLLLGLGAR